MSMEHKAYAFDYKAFRRRLAPLLYAALQTRDCARLVAFIDRHRAELTDLETMEVGLGPDWRERWEEKDPHRLGDLALTRYYDPGAPSGLSYDWQEVIDAAAKEAGNARAELLVLGTPFGPPRTYFDPGKMGSYFQTPGQVCRNHGLLLRLLDRRPELRDLAPYYTAEGQPLSIGLMFEEAVDADKGLYVTF
jgi:hypothetical protein